jgi:hypothetical protein
MLMEAGRGATLDNNREDSDKKDDVISERFESE